MTPYTEGHSERDWAEHRPQSPTMTARALWPLGQVRPLHAAVGLLPRGTRTTEALEQRMAELHPEPWPARRFWAAAVRLSDGERVVFGRDDVQTTAAEAVRASCAVPIRYEPVTVDGRRYVDGGVHSYTNADLMGPPAFDVVIVSSPMSGPPGWPEVRDGLSKAWTSTLAGLGLGLEREAAADRGLVVGGSRSGVARRTCLEGGPAAVGGRQAARGGGRTDPAGHRRAGGGARC